MYTYVDIRIRATHLVQRAQTLNARTLCWNTGPNLACTNTSSHKGTSANDSPNTVNTDTTRYTPDQFSPPLVQNRRTSK